MTSNVLKIFFFFISVISYHSSPLFGGTSCPGSNCDYYAQVGLATGCQGMSEYPMGYGKKYCDRFSDWMNKPNASAAVQCWICGTRNCLMEQMKNEVRDIANANSCVAQYQAWSANPDPTTSQALQDCIYRNLSPSRREAKRVSICNKMKNNAFATHSRCYRKAGLFPGGCDLTCVGYAELLQIPGVPDIKDLATLPSLQQCVETGVGYCTDLGDALGGSLNGGIKGPGNQPGTRPTGGRAPECIHTVQ